MRLIVIIAIITLLVAACSGDESAQQGVCYSFDERSCQGDPWNKDQPAGTILEVTERAKSYFKDQGIDIISIEIDPTYHTIVCLACVVCPAGPRYYIEVASDDVPKLKEIDLLGVEQPSDCKQ